MEKKIRRVEPTRQMSQVETEKLLKDNNDIEGLSSEKDSKVAKILGAIIKRVRKVKKND